MTAARPWLPAGAEVLQGVITSCRVAGQAMTRAAAGYGAKLDGVIYWELPA